MTANHVHVLFWKRATISHPVVSSRPTVLWTLIPYWVLLKMPNTFAHNVLRDILEIIVKCATMGFMVIPLKLDQAVNLAIVAGDHVMFLLENAYNASK